MRPLKSRVALQHVPSRQSRWRLKPRRGSLRADARRPERAHPLPTRTAAARFQLVDCLSTSRRSHSAHHPKNQNNEQNGSKKAATEIHVILHGFIGLQLNTHGSVPSGPYRTLDLVTVRYWAVPQAGAGSLDTKRSEHFVRSSTSAGAGPNESSSPARGVTPMISRSCLPDCAILRITFGPSLSLRISPLTAIP